MLQGLGGIGAFFRVGFWGAVPQELRGVEFVYRVPVMTQMHDFKERVLQLTRAMVSDPSKVSRSLTLRNVRGVREVEGVGHKRHWERLTGLSDSVFKEVGQGMTCSTHEGTFIGRRDSLFQSFGGEAVCVRCAHRCVNS